MRAALRRLPFIILGIVIIYILLLFLGVIESFITSDQVVMADISAANFISGFRDSTLVKIFFSLTLLGKFEIVISLSIILTVIFLLRRKKNYILPLWAVLAGNEFFNLLTKLTLHRQRPGDGFYIENSFSFPSGHAARAMVFYGFIAYVLSMSVKKRGSKAGILLAAAIIILAVGFSRLYLGVHFLSDVLGGYALGLLWLMIGIRILRRAKRLAERP